jgi:hypothetical protein
MKTNQVTNHKYKTIALNPKLIEEPNHKHQPITSNPKSIIVTYHKANKSEGRRGNLH